jgi:hypothetical protein
LTRPSIFAASEQRGKLVTAEPGNGVTRLNTLGQSFARLLQDRVAHEVPEFIVNRLEVIDIDEQQREGPAMILLLRR